MLTKGSTHKVGEAASNKLCIAKSQPQQCHIYVRPAAFCCGFKHDAFVQLRPELSEAPFPPEGPVPTLELLTDNL